MKKKLLLQKVLKNTNNFQIVLKYIKWLPSKRSHFYFKEIARKKIKIPAALIDLTVFL